jgi:ferritin
VWKSPLEVFRNAYAHEQKVTGLIHDLVELAAAEKDHAAAVLLDWYVAEQVEEEASASEIVAQLTAVKDSAPALFMLDAKLGQRE